MAVILNESLDPGLELLAGFRHGVPVQGAHQRLHLLDQVLNFVMGLCIDLYLRDAAHQIVQRVEVRLAGRPKLLFPHLREVSPWTCRWSLVMSSSGLAARMVKMQLLSLFCPFCIY